MPLEQRLAPAAAVTPDRLVREGDTLDWQHRATLFGRFARLNADLAASGMATRFRSGAALRLAEVARSL